MKNILVTYQSKSGTTKKYGEAIADYLTEKKLDSTVKSIDECQPEDVNKADAVLLGCWTHGLMIMLQHPEKKWVKFAKGLPSLEGKKVGLFTTYKLATGSMFRKMALALNDKSTQVDFELKSKKGVLSDKDKQLLDTFVTS